MSTTTHAATDQQYKVDLNPETVAETSDTRTAWFREVRFGMFVHWGLYSELAGSYGGYTLPTRELPNGKSWYTEWVQMRLEVPKELGAATKANMLETGEPVELLNFGRTIKKPKGSIDPNVATLRLEMK